MTVELIPAADAGTLYGLLRARTALSPDAEAYRQFNRRNGKWFGMNWSEVLLRTDRFASALDALGLEQGDRVAILLQNCIDWVCFDMAAGKLGLVVVPLYTNDAVFNTAYLIDDSAPRLLLVDTDARWEAIEAALGDGHSVEKVWVQSPTREPAEKQSDPRRRPLENALDTDGDRETDSRSQPDDLAALIYTSGTTGNPKGVMLTHGAMLENAEAVSMVVPPIRGDIFLSILPLAHGFERTMGYVLAMMGGACVAYAQSLLRLRQDLTTVRPTVIMGVPRFYESIHSSAKRAVAGSPIRRTLFDMTSRIGWLREAERRGLGERPGPLDRLIWPLLDRLVARKISDAFGGRMRVAVSGGANFPAEISRSMVGLGIPMVEGYGLTEAGPVVTASETAEYRPGHVGYVMPGIEVKQGKDGELLVRTPGRMSGYWKRPDASAEMLDEDGWLHTGDLAEVKDGNWIRISGRLKHILVLSNGENVNPRPIETALEADSLFDQVCIAGDGRPNLSVLLALNPELWKDLAKRKGLDETKPNAPEAEKIIRSRIKKHLKGFTSYHIPRNYHAVLEEWSVERRLLTPTLKLRRERIVALYENEIARMYSDS